MSERDSSTLKIKNPRGLKMTDSKAIIPRVSRLQFLYVRVTVPGTLEPNPNGPHSHKKSERVHFSLHFYFFRERTRAKCAKEGRTILHTIVHPCSFKNLL